MNRTRLLKKCMAHGSFSGLAYGLSYSIVVYNIGKNILMMTLIY